MCDEGDENKVTRGATETDERQLGATLFTESRTTISMLEGSIAPSTVDNERLAGVKEFVCPLPEDCVEVDPGVS